jgi:RNA polymerase sigma-70 factor (ECF subfamily)
MEVRAMTDRSDNKAACDLRFDKVYDDTFVDVRRYVAVRCADTMDLSDVLQEIYLEYYRLLRRKGLSYVENDAAMVFTIAQRKVKRYYSRKEKLRKILPLVSKDLDGEEEMIELPDPVSVEETVLSSVEADRIKARLARYPAETRKIVYLYYAEEMKLEDIAKEMVLPLSTVKSRLYRTLRELKKNLEGK